MAIEENSISVEAYEDDFGNDGQESGLDFESLSARIHQKIKGDTALITCETEFYTENLYYVDINITWSAENKTYYFSRGEKFEDDPRFSVFGENHLKIEKVQHEHAGLYTCTILLSDHVQSVYKIKYNLKIFEKYFFKWEKNLRVLSNEYPYRTYDMDKTGPWLKHSTGLILEIQKLQPQHNSTDINCKIEGYQTKTRSGQKKFEVTATLMLSDVSNDKASDQKDKCVPSPCGLNSECYVTDDIVNCVCRKNFRWNPPKCEHDCHRSGCAFGACLNEKCKNLCETSCGRNAKCLIEENKYICTCLDGYLGNPYTACNQTQENSETSDINIATYVQPHKEFVNSKVILPCEASNFDSKNIKFQWTKVPATASFRHPIDNSWPRIQLYAQYNLVIEKVQPEDSGNYVCELGTKPIRQQILYTLKISDSKMAIRKSHVEPFSTIVRAQLDTTVILPCEAIYSPDNFDMDYKSKNIIGLMKWVKSQKINEFETDIVINTFHNDSNSRLKISKGMNLELKNVQTEDAGAYTCVLESDTTNLLEKISVSHDLIILDPPPSSNDPCIRSPCGENSECYPDKNRAICTCRMGYIGNDPICSKGCYGDHCIVAACVNEHCKELCQQSCGQNEECRIQEYIWTCKCKNGFSENLNGQCVSDYPDTCGPECWAAISGALLMTVVILALITLIIKKFRARRNRTNAKLSTDQDVTMRLLPNYIAHHPEFYDPKWEFSRQRITMDEIIGEGHFGRVFKAQASGLPGHHGVTTVAVKTLKPNATGSQLDDLISEYKLLKELDHPNVIHLLGVCTKKGPFYVIMEYAENGCLRSYLKSIKKEKVKDEVGKVCTPILTTITPKDILSFAWQIAKGMAYLAEQKLVHRDLATRNILLTKDLVCKISDFGLTKDVYRDGKFVNKSKAEVPIKWMAIESLFNDTFTTKSDIWSFGIVLWELITFGETPYPGLQTREVYNYLIQGNRMKKPEGCSEEFYEIMLSCWKENPDDRPKFRNLVDKFDDMLGAGIYYLESSNRGLDYGVLA